MIKIEKVTLNIGSGSEKKDLENARKLLKKISGQTAVGKKTKKRIPTWSVRKKMIVGCKTTLRGKKALDILKTALQANDNIVKKKSFADDGNFSLGIKSYIDLPGFRYDPEIGLMGFDVCVTIRKWGYGINKKKIKPGKIPKKHRVTKEETMEFMKKEFGITIE